MTKEKTEIEWLQNNWKLEINNIGANRNWEYLKEKINDLEMNRKNNHI
jgi:hypothetical protein